MKLMLIKWQNEHKSISKQLFSSVDCPNAKCRAWYAFFQAPRSRITEINPCYLIRIFKPTRSQVWKVLLINMDFNRQFPQKRRVPVTLIYLQITGAYHKSIRLERAWRQMQLLILNLYENLQINHTDTHEQSDGIFGFGYLLSPGY